MRKQYKLINNKILDFIEIHKNNDLYHYKIILNFKYKRLFKTPQESKTFFYIINNNIIYYVRNNNVSVKFFIKNNLSNNYKYYHTLFNNFKTLLIDNAF